MTNSRGPRVWWHCFSTQAELRSIEKGSEKDCQDFNFDFDFDNQWKATSMIRIEQISSDGTLLDPPPTQLQDFTSKLRLQPSNNNPAFELSGMHKPFIHWFRMRSDFSEHWVSAVQCSIELCMLLGHRKGRLVFVPEFPDSQVPFGPLFFYLSDLSNWLLAKQNC